MNISRRLFGATLMLLLLSACTTSGSGKGTDAEPITFTATRTELVGPSTALGGYATLSFTNESDSLMAHALVRIKDGVSADSGLRAVRIFHGLERGDRIAAMGAIDGFYGGAVFVAPGASKAVGVELPPGRYVSYADVVSGDEPRVHAGFVTPIDVRGETDVAEPPAPAHTIRMRDFAFEAPRRVTSGRSRWRVENAGTKEHLVFIARMRPGHTYDDTKRWLTNPEGPPPVEETTKPLGVHALSHGVFNDVDLDLEPGEYVLICFIEGHHLMGMVSPLSVTK